MISICIYIVNYVFTITDLDRLDVINYFDDYIIILKCAAMHLLLFGINYVFIII